MKTLLLSITMSLITLSIAGCTRVPTRTAPTLDSLITDKSSAIVYPPPGIKPSPIYPTQDSSSSHTYPAPGIPGAITSLIPTSSYEPQTGDENLKREQVLLDLASSRIVMNPTEPVQAVANLMRSRPDPCHVLRVIVTPSDEQNTIRLEAYSLVEQTRPCITALSEFSATIFLGGFAPEVYSVVVNGVQLRQFDTSYAPKPSGYEPQGEYLNLKREPITLDMSGSQLVVTGFKPVQVKAILTGSLPDPCHKLRVKMDPPDAGGTISIMIYSVFDPSTACISTVEPFNANISLGIYYDGQYTVLVSAAPGGLFGQFNANLAPQPGDEQLKRGEVTLDMTLTKLASTGGGSDPRNIPAANIQGSLPDSCYQLRIGFNPAYDVNKVDLEVYSVFDPQTVCKGVTQPFQVIYPLGGASQSSVFVNGQFVGKFQWGG